MPRSKQRNDKDCVGGTKFNPLKLLLWLLPSLVALALAGTYYFRWQQARQDPEKFLAEQAKAEIDLVVAKVSKLMVLPEDEVPTLVTIDNKDEISRNQEFFKLAENGDQMLMYRESRKAILYRPTTNQIVNVAPVNFEAEEAEKQEEEPASPSGETAP